MEIHSESGGGEPPLHPTLEDLGRLCAELNRRRARYVLVGGFAVALHGYIRVTTDIDLLIETTPENERAALDALLILPDGAARQVSPGEVGKYGVVRVGDAVTVDLMAAGCGVTFADAFADAVQMTVHGVPVPTASLATLWRMKQTARVKDAGDRVFLREKLAAAGIHVEDQRARHPDADLPAWLRRALEFVRWLFRRKSGEGGLDA